MRHRFVVLISGASLAFATAAAAADGGTTAHNSVYTTRNADDLLAATRAARPMQKLVDPKALPRDTLLRNNALPSGADAPKPGASGASADGVHSQSGDVGPEAYGNGSPLAIAPYSAGGAYADVKGPTSVRTAVGVTSFPWRAAGKLYFNIGSSAYVCSASMIKPGLIVTAAHCVFEYGTNSAAGWHTNFVFVPARYDSTNPYGTWTALTERIPTSYYNGTDTCAQRGVICNNDIAIITAAANANGKLPGQVVGWYGYGWNGYSYVSSFGGASLSSLTQLGYPYS